MYALYRNIGQVQTLPTDYIHGCLAASSQLGIPPAHLHALVLIEGGIGNLQKINSSGYGGLGQWGNPAAKELGYSSVRIMLNANPTYKAQWALMVRWISFLIKTYGKGTYYGPGFLYVCHFLPYNAKFYNQKNKVLYNSDLKEYLRTGSTTYTSNKPLDFDKNGEITIGDLDNIVYSRIKSLGTDYAQAPTNTGNSLTDLWNKGIKSAKDYAIDLIVPKEVQEAQKYFGQFGELFKFVDNYGQELLFIGMCFIAYKGLDLIEKKI